MVKATAGEIIADPGAAAEKAVLASRGRRIYVESENKTLGRAQKFFRKGVLGWVAKTTAQSVPVLGDGITALNAISGYDVLTGEKLDVVDRLLNGAVTFIPFVPGTLVIDPIRRIRRGVEDAVYAKSKGDAEGMIKAANELKSGIQLGRQVIQNRPPKS